MVPDKFNMVDMEGIDIILDQGTEIPGLYQKLVESIAQCRYQCLYNWKSDEVNIPPTFVELVVDPNNENVLINTGIQVTSEDVIVSRISGLVPVATTVLTSSIATEYEMADLLATMYQSWLANHIYFFTIRNNTSTSVYAGLFGVINVKSNNTKDYAFVRSINITTTASPSYDFVVTSGAMISIYDEQYLDN